jgi:hypothetical protein
MDLIKINIFNKVVILGLISLSLSCNSISNSDQETNLGGTSYQFSFDKEINRYVLAKLKNHSIPVDTVYYFKDSLKQELSMINTLIYRGSDAKINQVIKYYDGLNIDTSSSYFFNVRMLNDSIKLKVGSMYNDTIYLEIGDLDENYNNVGKVDSFEILNKSITIPYKRYYNRARIGIWKRTFPSDSIKKADDIEFYETGKVMYVLSKYFNRL